MPKITKRLIDAIEPSAERIIVWDSEIKGFGMIALPSGLRSFFVQYRNESGRKRRLTLGRFGVMTAEGARKAARDALATVGRGVDPVEDRQALRAAPSVSQLLDRYLAEHVDVHNASRTADGVRFAIKRHILPRLGTLRAAAVTRQDVLKLHGAMQATPRHANLTLSILSKAFNLAELGEFDQKTPIPVAWCRAIRNPIASASFPPTSSRFSGVLCERRSLPGCRGARGRVRT